MALRFQDIDDTDRHRWCEYIMYRGLQRLGYARISKGHLSDTEVQVGRFHLPVNVENFNDNDVLTKSVKDVPAGSRFPSLYVFFD